MENIKLVQYFFHLLDLRNDGFAAWEREMEADIRLTSGPWVGWHEEVAGPSLFG